MWLSFYLVNCPTRWSLLFIFVFLCWSSRVDPNLFRKRIFFLLLWLSSLTSKLHLSNFHSKSWQDKSQRQHEWLQALRVLPSYTSINLILSNLSLIIILVIVTIVWYGSGRTLVTRSDSLSQVFTQLAARHQISCVLRFAAFFIISNRKLWVLPKKAL